MLFLIIGPLLFVIMRSFDDRDTPLRIAVLIPYSFVQLFTDKPGQRLILRLEHRGPGTMCNQFVLFSLIRTLASPKALSLDNKNKNRYFCFVLFSLIRTFVP